MARPLRLEYSGAVYHITARGNAGQDIFRADEDRERFLAILGDTVERLRWLCHAYCLMENHYHLLLETPEPNLSRGMRQLNGIYTQAFNRTYQRAGHLFQGRYKAILVEKEAHLLALNRSIVLNPVAAGLVKSPDQWEWSSYEHTVNGKPRGNFLATDWILGRFARGKTAARRAYRKYIAEELTEQALWDQLRGQVFLGGEDFLRGLEPLIKQQRLSREVPRRQRHPLRPPLDVLLANRRDTEERNAGIVQAHVVHGYTLKEIGKFLGIHYTTVSRIARPAGQKKC